MTVLPDGGGPFRLSSTGGELTPFRDAQIEVVFKPPSFGLATGSLQLEVFEADERTGASPVFKLEMTLLGQSGHDTVGLSKKFLDFSDLAVGRYLRQALTVRMNGQSTLKRLEALPSLSDGAFVAMQKRVFIDGSTHFVVFGGSVRGKELLLPSPEEEMNLMVSYEAIKSGMKLNFVRFIHLPSATATILPIVGSAGQSRFLIEPTGSTCDFGIAAVGSYQQRTIRLKNIGNMPLMISSIASSNSNLLRWTISQSSACTSRIEFGAEPPAEEEIDWDEVDRVHFMGEHHIDESKAREEEALGDEQKSKSPALGKESAFTIQDEPLKKDLVVPAGHTAMLKLEVFVQDLGEISCGLSLRFAMKGDKLVSTTALGAAATSGNSGSLPATPSSGRQRGSPLKMTNEEEPLDDQVQIQCFINGQLPLRFEVEDVDLGVVRSGKKLIRELNFTNASTIPLQWKLVCMETLCRPLTDDEDTLFEPCEPCMEVSIFAGVAQPSKDVVVRE